MLFPADGITLIASILHAHLLATSITTSLVRNGIEIKKLFDNPNYNFNYQMIMDIEPTKVYPVIVPLLYLLSIQNKNLKYLT